MIHRKKGTVKESSGPASLDYDASAIEDLSTLLSSQVLPVGTNVKKGGGLVTESFRTDPPHPLGQRTGLLDKRTLHVD